MNNDSAPAKLLSARTFVNCLAVVGFFAALSYFGTFIHKPVRWSVLDEYPESEADERHGAIIEGVIGGNLPWQQPSRFWLRLKDGKWESTWVKEGKKLEWHEASQEMLQNPSYESHSTIASD